MNRGSYLEPRWGILALSFDSPNQAITELIKCRFEGLGTLHEISEWIVHFLKKLRYDIYLIKYTDLKCIAWWVLIFGSTPVTNFSAHFPRLLGAPSYLYPTPEFTTSLIFSRVALSILKHHINGLREYGFACVCFFHSMKYLWYPSMLLHVTIFSSFSVLGSIP